MRRSNTDNDAHFRKVSPGGHFMVLRFAVPIKGGGQESSREDVKSARFSHLDTPD